MKPLVLPLLLWLAAASVGGGAQVVQPKAAGDPSTVNPASEKKVCHSEIATGSLMAKRKCATKAEWMAIDRANQASAQAVLDQRGRAGATRD